ncbi:hypothetical protein [Paenibacillus sp. Leaf72]|nr:hypothetical protein [Paenibacillus sp. Leaf72]
MTNRNDYDIILKKKSPAATCYPLLPCLIVIITLNEYSKQIFIRQLPILG